MNSAEGPVLDRRVRRSRAALMAAAIAVVSRHAGTAVSLSEIAEEADVGRKVIYQQFGDRETLLTEAALDLARRELLPIISTASRGRSRTVAYARHFADHHVFYRAVLTSAGSYRLEAGLAHLLWPYTRERLGELYGGRLDAQMIDDLTVHLGGGSMALLKSWLLNSESALDAEAFADRSLSVSNFVVPQVLDPDEVRRRVTAYRRAMEPGNAELDF